MGGNCKTHYSSKTSTKHGGAWREMPVEEMPHAITQLSYTTSLTPPKPPPVTAPRRRAPTEASPRPSARDIADAETAWRANLPEGPRRRRRPNRRSPSHR